jgi:aminoglycoside phosphotransferase (APT) family kinase protein
VKRVLVTGGASGLGLALVQQYAARGDRVLSCDLTAPEPTDPVADPDRAGPTTADPTGNRTPGEVVHRALDVRSEEDWEAARAWVECEWGGLDVLVNNAGAAGRGRIELTPVEDWQWILDVNLLGVVRGVRAFTPMLQAQGSGWIVNTASLAGLVHPPGMGSYNASKAAVVAFSETVSHELAPYGVGCSAVCPSYFRTNLMSSMRGRDAVLAATMTRMVEESPITADDVAADAAGRDLILRRPPTGSKAKGAHDMRREFTIQSRLAPVFPRVPAMLAFCDDRDVIGSDFYVMERLEGTILRRDLPKGLALSAADARTLCDNFLDVLVELHSVNPSAAGLDDLGKGEGYVARQVGGWSDRFRRARTADVGDFETVMGWLDAEQPPDVTTCVIHNDFRLDNVVLDPDDPLRVVGVLDWEMATLGDPLMDLSGALAYWIQADDDEAFQLFRRQPTHLPGMYTRAEMVERYTARTGRSMTPERWRFYEVFGLFRLAVIAQQIYYRFSAGQTTNEAYAGFLPVVQYLDERCRRLVAEAAA